MTSSVPHVRNRSPSLAVGVTAIALIAAVSTAGSPAAASPARDAHRAGAKVQLVGSRYGKIIVDGDGLTLYAFTKDDKNKSNCYGGCAEAWPPLYTRGKPEAIGGARDRRLGVTERRNGRKQVTYGGNPLYYYIGEDAPGEIFCQNVFQYGGLWLLVDRGGDPIR